MKRLGLTTLALMIGCAGGVALREVVFPARAASGPSYGYKVVQVDDLIETVQQRNPAFAKADKRAALEEGLAGFGRGGWRYAGCLQPASFRNTDFIPGGFICNQLIFEQGGAGVPLAGTTSTPAPPPETEAPSHR